MTGQYGIVYKNNLYYEFDYLENGKLESVGVRTGLVYPLKVYEYNSQKALITVRLELNPKDCYVFSANRALIAHWIYGVCYDINGNVINRILK